MRALAFRSWPARCAVLMGMVLCLALPVRQARGDALERLRLDRLHAVHEQVEQLAVQRQPVEPVFDMEDVRAVLHVHSAFSHDSRAPLDEILTAARKLGIRVVMFSEHPGDHFDYVTDGHQGVHDGVLLIPGAETGGVLAFPTRSLRGQPSSPPQPFVDLVRQDGGVVFLSHLEDRLDWQLTGLTGSEIYNSHADVKDELRLQNLLKSPVGLLTLARAVREFPQETFSAIGDYPAEYLQRYDQLTARERLCGIAANDAHHNQVYRLLVAPDRQLRLEDALGKILLRVPTANTLASTLLVGKQPGDVLVELDLDPYELSLNHVSTHLWLEEFSQCGVRAALQAGRAYVSFDWMTDPGGFTYYAQLGEQRWPLGSEVAYHDGLLLKVAAPLPVEFRILADGQEVHRRTGRSLQWTVPKSGVYRVEAWLTLAGEPRPWILSNPIYVRP